MAPAFMSPVALLHHDGWVTQEILLLSNIPNLTIILWIFKEYMP